MDDYEIDDDVYFDDDYVYVDESYDLADELAETAIPEPPYFERIEDGWGDYDNYDYWMDIEYNTDEYYDAIVGAGGKESGTQAGQKRRRVNDDDGHGKRRKVSSAKAVTAQSTATRGITPVVWLSFTETHSLRDSERSLEKGTSYALLADWRKRFMDAPGFYTADSQRATVDEMDDVEAGDDYDEEEDDMEDKNGQGDEYEDEDEDERDEEESGIDAEQIMGVLQAKLAESGLEGAQKEKFMEAIMGMMAGGDGGGVEELLEELTSSLLGQASDGGADSSAAQWLTQQGVSLESAGDDENEGAGSEATHTSPQKVAVKDAIPQNSTENGLPAQESEEEPKAPDPSTILDQQVLEDLEAAPEPSKDLKNNADDPPKQDDTNTKTKGATKAPETADRTLRGKRSTASIADTNSHDPSQASKSKTASETSKVSVKATKAAPAKATIQARKRKAPPEEPSAAAEKPKRQQRSFAAPTASSQGKAAETTKRATRSTRQSKK